MRRDMRKTSKKYRRILKRREYLLYFSMYLQTLLFCRNACSMEWTARTQIFDNERDNIFKVNSLVKHLLHIYRQQVRHE